MANFGIDPEAPLPMEDENVIVLPAMQHFLSPDEVLELEGAINLEEPHDIWSYNAYMQCCTCVEEIINNR